MGLFPHYFFGDFMINFKNEEKIKTKYKSLKSKLLVVEIIKLTLLISFLVLIILAISLNNILFYILSGIIFVILLISLFTNNLYDKKEDLKKLLDVYEIHKKRRSHELKLFFNDGKEYINNDYSKSNDLDLFGSNSIYQYLSSARTKYGKDLLKDHLLNKQEPNLEMRESVYEMSNLESTLNLEAKINYFNNKQNVANLDEFNSVINNKIKLNIFRFIPLISFILLITSIVLSIFRIISPYFIILFVITNLVSTFIFSKNDIFKLNLRRYLNSCNYYLGFINKLKNTEYKTKYINELKNEILKEEENLKSIKKIYILLEYRLNIIFNVLLNSLFIFDFFAILIFNHNTKKGNKIKDLFLNVAKIEVMISLANVGIDNDIYTIPKESDYFKIDDMYHPLIKNPVSNSIVIKGGIIITGSNMSGKTTFLRTLGINQILKNANGLVFASNYEAPNIEVYTSLRTTDKLSEGISSFQAEINKLKLINEKIVEEKSLILIDEIFKGTNTNDRISAAKNVIKKLNDYNQFFLITTHDDEICDENNITNYHFSESYQDDKIIFDYKIKTGKAETKNAIYLLKMANII